MGVCMQASVLTEVLLPLALAFVMFGMGLTLTLADFARLLKAPKAVITGVIGQIILLPMLALGLCFVFGLPGLYCGWCHGFSGMPRRNDQ